MNATDKKAPAKSGDKVVRMCPDNELKAPVKSFSETFSGEAVVMEHFFVSRLPSPPLTARTARSPSVIVRVSSDHADVRNPGRELLI